MPDTDKPFEPDWCIAPAVTLREWMKENAVTSQHLTRLAGRGESDIKARRCIGEVLTCGPLSAGHAEVLERGTGIPAHFWLRSEENYRAGLAAGLTDVTPEWLRA
jgi:hypothetical protein